jgi:PRTRC genetic system protein E
MFKELAPLLRQRCVVMTVTCTNDDIRVVVAPKKLNDSENVALTTNLEIKGTAEELDEQLPSALTQFVGSHLELSASLETAKEIMATAAKKAKADAKEKAAGKPATTKPAAVQKPGTTPAKPIEEKKEEKKPVVPRTASLFDMPAPAPTPAAPTPAPVSVTEDESGDDEDEILSDIASNNEDEDDSEAA